MRVADHQRLLETAQREVQSLKSALRVEFDDGDWLKEENRRLRDDRRFEARFEAAKAAMQGLIGRMKVGDSMGDVACAATGLADALLAELDRPREEPGPLHEDD